MCLAKGDFVSREKWIHLLSCLLAVASVTFSADAVGNAEYVAAHAKMAEGHTYEGAVQLLDLLRSVPGDDYSMADSMVGPAQLLGFSIVSLMDWSCRTFLLNNVLWAGDNEFDALLVSVLKAGSGVQSMALPALQTLKDMTRSEHQVYRLTALCILAGQNTSGGSGIRDAVVSFALGHPQLEASQSLLEGPTIRVLRNYVQGNGVGDGILLDPAVTGAGRDALLKASPGLSLVAQQLPSMNARDIKDDTVSAWAESIKIEKVPRSRYTVIAFLAVVSNTPARRDAMRMGLEAVAAMPPNTPDVLRAHMVLANNGCADHDAGMVKEHALALLKLGVLPCTAERSMYEAVMQTVQLSAKYFTRYGWYKDAVLLHEKLAAKYPDTVLAVEEVAKADALRENPDAVALDLIDREAQVFQSRGDRQKARSFYQEIMEHTPQPSLKTALESRIQKLVQTPSLRYVEDMRLPTPSFLR